MAKAYPQSFVLEIETSTGEIVASREIDISDVEIPADGGPVHTRMRRPTIESGDEASDVDSAVTPYTPRGRGEQVRARSAVRV